MVNALHICSSVTRYNIVHFTEITVGFVDTSVTVFESAGVAQLTVAISVPPGTDPIETSFSLLVNTNDGTATAGGLSTCLEIDLHIHTHFSATESLDYNYTVKHPNFKVHNFRVFTDLSPTTKIILANLFH